MRKIEIIANVTYDLLRRMNVGCYSQSIEITIELRTEIYLQSKCWRMLLKNNL